jgi:hypothetical protein
MAQTPKQDPPNIIKKDTQVNDKYDSLKQILDKAFAQASEGKGKERHANDKAFDDQPIMWIEEHFKSYQLGQSVKKIHESQNLPTERAIAELCGAINYLAAHILHLQKQVIGIDSALLELVKGLKPHNYTKG